AVLFRHARRRGPGSARQRKSADRDQSSENAHVRLLSSPVRDAREASTHHLSDNARHAAVMVRWDQFGVGAGTVTGAPGGTASGCAGCAGAGAGGTGQTERRSASAFTPASCARACRTSDDFWPTSWIFSWIAWPSFDVTNFTSSSSSFTLNSSVKD